MGMDHHCLVIIGIEIERSLWGKEVQMHRPSEPCGTPTCPLLQEGDSGKFCNECGKHIAGHSWTHYEWLDDIPEILIPFSKKFDLFDMTDESNRKDWPLKFAVPFQFGEGCGLYLGDVVGMYSRWNNKTDTLTGKDIQARFQNVASDLQSLGLDGTKVQMHFVQTWA